MNGSNLIPMIGVLKYLIILLAQREESIVPPFSRRNPLVNLLGGFVVYGKHHGALPKHLTKKTKKALSAFFVFCRNLCKRLVLKYLIIGR